MPELVKATVWAVLLCSIAYLDQSVAWPLLAFGLAISLARPFSARTAGLAPTIPPTAVLGIFTLVTSAVYTSYSAPVVGTAFAIIPTLSSTEVAETVRAIALLVAASCLAFHVTSHLMSTPGRGRGRRPSGRGLVRVKPHVEWAAVAAALGCLYVGKGPSLLLEREHYIVEPASKALLLAGVTLLPIAIILASAGSLHRSAASLAFAVGGCVWAFAAGSRTLVPFAIILIARLVPHRRWVLAPLIAAAVPAALNLPLWLRQHEGTHGLVPYALLVVSDPIGAMAGRLDDLAGNLFIGFPVTFASASKLQGFANQVVIAALDPLPGAGRYAEFEPRLSFVRYSANATFPLNGLGTLWASGTGWLVGTGLVFGMIDGLVLQAARDRLGSRFLAVASIGLGALATYSLSQYSIRQSLRLYEMLLFVSATFLIHRCLSRSHVRRSHRTEALVTAGA